MRLFHHGLVLFAGAMVALPCQTLAATGPGQIAFPGAEGHGRLSDGGRGGAVIYVTNLEDSGPGSLRAAIDAKGPRTVVFSLSGTIHLKSPLKIAHPRITIAGQTAPGDGITLADQPLIIEADDVVVRYIRSRLGDESGVQDDAVTVSRGSRIIIDHVSASWSVDETLSVGSRYNPPEAGVYDVTVQWSLIGDSLNRSLHAKGRHGYGSLIRGGYGARFSFHHNLWANHLARMPRPGNYNPPALDPEGPRIEFRNNVFYNWGGEASGYNADSAAMAAYDFIGNAYLPGPDSRGSLAFCEQNSLSRAYFADNAMAGRVPADPWFLVGCTPPASYRSEGPLASSGLTTSGPTEAQAAVLARAGASRVRDSVDQRIIEGVLSGEGRRIDSQQEVGGWPELSSGTAPKDSDQDGMPDDWERNHGLDPANPADGAQDPDGDGYTNLEDYLNSLV
ncbi:MAG: pectate lyase [Caulobacter sp.]|nr:pectate lyase [Caulobacter sp.]